MNRHDRVRSGFRQTEVGLIPGDWGEHELAALASMKSGLGITSSSIDEGAEYPCYGGNGLRGRTNRFTHDGSFALIGRQGALCGNVLRVDGRFFASEHAVVVTASAGTDIDWLALVLGELRLNQYSESSAQPGLSVAKILSLRVAVPPTDKEQRAIATALGDAEALIGALEASISKKRDIKRAAMQQLLTGRTRLPGFNGAWKANRLGDSVVLRGDRVDPRTSRPNQFCVELEHIGSGSGNLLGFGATSVESSFKSAFRAGDVLFGKLRAYLRKYWRADRLGVCSTEIWVLFAREDCLTSGYLFQVVQTDAFIETASTSHGTHMPRSDWKVVSNYELELPPTLTEQTAIAAVLSDMDAEIAALEARRDKVRAIKHGMMQELLTGRIRLQ